MTIVHDVLTGKDGWLFLHAGTNDVLQFYLDAEQFGAREKSGWSEILLSRHRKARILGATYVHLAAPDKLSIYSDMLMRDDINVELAPSRALPLFMDGLREAELLKSLYVDPLSFLSSDRQAGRLLYWKTDTHWTFYGALSACKALCYRLSARLHSTIDPARLREWELVLDLGGKLNPQVTERFQVREVPESVERIFANDLVLFKERNGLEHEAGLHVGSHVIYRNTATNADPRRVILFGDSFSEFRPHLLMGMIAETFREVHFIWSGSIDWEYVARVKPNIIISEFAERFMRELPADDFNVEKCAADRLGTYQLANPHLKSG